MAEDFPVKSGRGFWKKRFTGIPTRRQKYWDVFVGMLLPVACVVFDPFVFQRRIPGDSSQDTAMLEAIQILAYAVIALEVVLLAVASATRASKGRAALREDLTRMVSEVLAAAGRRTVCILLGPKAALAGVAPQPRTLVGAWGAAPVCVRAALEVVLSGGPLRGLDPAP